MRRGASIGGPLTRTDIEQLLDVCDRLVTQHEGIVRILGEPGPAWSDVRTALNRLHAVLRR